MSPSKIQIIISGGGTGGHIYPAISIANALQKIDPELRIAFIGARDRLESQIVPQYGFQFFPISVAGFPRRLTLQWIPVMLKVIAGLIQAIQLLRQIKPLVVVGTGGYVSGLVLCAALLNRIPTVLQEQNAVPGLTNRILATWVREAYLALPAANSYFPPEVGKVTGNPIRPEIGQQSPRTPELFQKYGLSPDLKTIFVMGGSQGATAINQLILGMIDQISSTPDERRFQIIHQTGKHKSDQIRHFYGQKPDLRSLVKPYFDHVEEIYALTDLMICRSGGSTISEITACGIPAILIPRNSADNHQYHNAEALAGAGAAAICPQDQTTAADLADLMIDLLTDDGQLSQMAMSSRNLGQPNSSQAIACSILKSLSLRSKHTTCCEQDSEEHF